MDFDSLRPFLSRLAASFIAIAFAWLASKGFHLPPDAQQALTDFLVVLLIAMVSHGLSHRFIDKIVNPGDTASSHLAVSQKAQLVILKTTEEHRASRD